MSTERLTEAEWAQRQAERWCAEWGHDWQIIQVGDGRPVALVCSRPCGTPRYAIVREEA